MALCLAECLVERAAFDPVDQLERYVRWYREGHWSSTGRCFDIGNATRAALERFERTGEPFPGDAAPDAAGNGPLMKLAPVVLAYASRPGTRRSARGESARTTHGAPEAVDAVARVRRAAARARWRRATDAVPPAVRARPGARPVAAVAAALVPPRASRRQIRGGGYVVDALEAALWALRTTTTLRGRRARRGQPRRRRRHDRRDLRPARGRALRARRHPAHVARSGCIATTRSSRSPTRCYDLDVARPAIARFEHVQPTQRSSSARPPQRRRRSARSRGEPASGRGPQRRARLRRRARRPPAC